MAKQVRRVRGSDGLYYRFLPVRSEDYLGYSLSVEIYIDPENQSDRFWGPVATTGVIIGTVRALNPRVRPFWKGLFIDGFVLRKVRVLKVVTTHNGVDITKFVKMSLGPAM